MTGVQTCALPICNVLEIGNPSLAPNINLLYGLPQAQSYDAIDLRTYKEKFDLAFPIKNHWGKVEDFTYENLKRFGIKYMISDFNVNFTRQHVQPVYKSVIGPLTNNSSIDVTFIPTAESLSEVRFLPANYNRNNHCNIVLEIIDTSTGELIDRQGVNCLDILDKMFFTADLKNAKLSLKKMYKLKIYAQNTSDKNQIGIWGYDNKPFVELFYNNNSNKYKFLTQEKNLKLFEVPDVDVIEGIDDYHIVYNDASRFSFVYDSPITANVLVKRNFYPGWEGLLDDKKLQVENAKPFIIVSIPPGIHRVSIAYNPLSFKAGLLVSVIALITLVLLSKGKN